LPHAATDCGGWDVMIDAKAKVRLVLKKVGTVDYYCCFHPNMKGRIRVRP
jgi:plastocyanin